MRAACPSLACCSQDVCVCVFFFLRRVLHQCLAPRLTTCRAVARTCGLLTAKNNFGQTESEEMFHQPPCRQERRRRDATWQLRFQRCRKATEAEAVQRRPVRLTSDAAVTALLPLTMEEGTQTLQVQSEKGVQALPVRDVLANPWCRSWLARILRRGQRRYLTRAWCAWTREYVERRLETVLQARLRSRLQHGRCRSTRKFFSAWSCYRLQQHLVHARQVRSAKIPALEMTFSRLAMPGILMLRAVLRSWHQTILAERESLRSVFRRWHLRALCNRAARRVRKLLERETPTSRIQACFAAWMTSVKASCAERRADTSVAASIASSERAWRASHEQVSKLHRRALLEMLWSRWRHLAVQASAQASARASARLRLGQLLEMGRARRALLPFIGWKILLLARAPRAQIRRPACLAPAARQDPV